MADEILDPKIRDQLPDNDENLVYDRKLAVESAPKQELNKHQKRQLRKKNLLEKQKSKSSIKKEKEKKARRKIEEKYQRRDEIIKNASKVKLSKDEEAVIVPTSSLGVKLTKRQRYDEAVKRKSLGLPFDQEIIDEVERKIKASQEKSAADSNQDVADETVDNGFNVEAKITELPKPAAPLIKVVKEQPKKIEEEKKEVVETPQAPRPAINVSLNRPDGIDEIRSKLPIIGEEQTIMETIHENDTVIICGETGSGKTTQIPQFLYEAGYGTLRTKGKIAVTEPRRVAAINMSKRVAYETGLPFGQKVGYHIRNNKYYTDSTVIKFCTDGVLLREAEEDLLLSKYSVIIIDEAHERTVNTDVLIGLLSRIVVLRRKKVENGEANVEKLKLIIMSATLRVDDFLKNDRLFDKEPPLIKIDARQYPVSEHFARSTPKEEDRLNTVKHCVEMIHERMPPGGILVFLPGKSDIQNCVDYFRSLYSDKPSKVDKKHSSKSNKEDEEEQSHNITEEIEIEDVDEFMDLSGKIDIIDKKPMLCLPLYSLLPQEEQDKVFKKHPDGIRLVVFSTNIAETSVTIPNIKYVVDLGLEKSRTFDFAKGVISTTVDFISKASAEQRKGRAGRVGPGHCFRLYSAGFFTHFQEFTPPEIQRRPITEVVLLLKTMGLNEISKFPFPTLISDENLNHAETILKHIGLLELDHPYKATSLGKLVSQFPLEPRLGKLLVSARKGNFLEYAIAMAAALDVREPFSGKPDDSLISNRGDPFTLLNTFGAYLYAKDKRSFCRENNVKQQQMESIQQVRQQLTTIIWKNDRNSLKSDKAGLLEPYDDYIENQLAFCLFASYCDHVAKFEGKGNSYITCDNKKGELWGNSCLIDKKALYITYISIDEANNKNKFNNPIKISPLWINQIGSKLYLNRTSLGRAEYHPNEDRVVGRAEATFGQPNWRLTPADIPHPEPYYGFAAALLEGKVIPALKSFSSRLTANPEDLIDKRQLPQRLMLIVAELKRAQISSRHQLEERWAKEPLFLLSQFSMWFTDKSVISKIQQGWPFKSTTPAVDVEFSDSYSESD